MKIEEMIDFAKEQREIFGEGSQMRDFLEQFLKVAHSLKIIECNAYVIAEEIKTLRGD